MKFEFLAQRLFNTPLAIHPSKAEIVIAALSERLGIIRIDGASMSSFDELSRSGLNPRCGYDLVEGVAIIPVQGTLVQKLGTLRPYSGMTGYDGIRMNLLSAIVDPDVKAVVFDINSPGGEVSGCFDLVDTIYSCRGEKPIWAILNESAYSAAYAIASATDHITVPRTGGTGSIGVIWMHMDMSQAIKDNGLNVTIVRHGDRKAETNPYGPLTKKALQSSQEDIDEVGKLFADTVARNRGISSDSILSLQAATFQGQSGIEKGLADSVMAPDAAFLALLETLA